jgi:hypothetical protein
MQNRLKPSASKRQQVAPAINKAAALQKPMSYKNEEKST